MKKLFLLSIVLLLSACGSKIEGTYVSASNILEVTSLTFKSNGKLSIQSKKAAEFEVPYSEDGDKITAGVPFLLVRAKDGSIYSPQLGTFTKK